MFLQRKSIWYLALIFLILNPTFCSAVDILLILPNSTNSSTPFTANLTLLEFPNDIYDVKIDFLNSSGERITQILDNGVWQSTYNYITDIMNTSVSNNSLFSVNITQNYSGIASVEVKIRDSSNSITSFSGYNLTVFPYNSLQTPAPNTTNTTSPIYIELDYDDQMENEEELRVKVEAYNLENKDYDIKLYITFEENDSIISETYHLDTSDWDSSNYYVEEIISGPSNETKTMRIRIDEDYTSYTGDVLINAKIRESGKSSSIDDFQGELELIETETAPITTPDTTTTDTTTTSSTAVQVPPASSSEIISLNIPKAINTQNLSSFEYKSKSQYIKEYSIYAFTLFCVILIIVLLIKKQI